MAEIIAGVTDLPLDDIQIRDRLRPVSAAGVAAIRASVQELGVIKDKIHVRQITKGKAKRFVLLAGAHRLTVARQMRDDGDARFDPMPVICWRCSDDWARLIEVDDNLAGAELNALDTAVFLAERKRLYVKMHPETGRGGDRGNQHTGGRQTDIVSFCQTTAEKFNLTDRHVRRLVAAGEAVMDSAADLRAAPHAVTLADLAALAKIADPVERGDVVAAIRDGAKGAAKAIKARKAARGEGPAPVSPTDAEYLRLGDAFTRARKIARRRWAEDNIDDLRALLADIDGGAT